MRKCYDLNSSIIPKSTPGTTSVWDHVRGFEPLSLCDWPGKISCVLFLAGCNLRCPTCHNAKLAWAWHELPKFSRDAVLADLRTRVHWLDGITISGGEPTCTPGLDQLLTDLASLNLPLKLDSNGFAPDVMEQLLRTGLIQTAAVDVKGPWSLYPELTGGRKTAIDAKECLDQIFALAQEFSGQVYFRCTKVPRLTPADLETTRAQVPAALPLIFQEFVNPQGK